MFPLNDFNLMCCALVTVSAAVGYRFSRRRRSRSLNAQRKEQEQKQDGRSQSVSVSSSRESTMTIDTESSVSEPPVSECPSPSMNVNASDETEPDSLKRKHRDEETNDLDGERIDASETDRSLCPPRKRCKAPSASDDAEPTDDLEHAPVTTPEQVVEIAAAEGKHSEEVPAPNAVDQVKIQEEPVIIQASAKRLDEFKPSIFSSMQPIPAVKPSLAFKAFAESPSGFASTSTFSASTSGFKPVWCSTSTTPTASVNATVATPQTGVQVRKDVATTKSSSVFSLSESASPPLPVGVEDPLAACTRQMATHSTLTGEEDEIVHAELKGVRVFVKRGECEFSNGILGHVKILMHKESQEERILFRREPVWKVSMSVRLRPTVRCTFDEEQSVLRIVLKELEECDDVPADQLKQQIVVYALKRGKASKSDFVNFAHAVVGSSHLYAPASAPPPDGAA